MSTRSKTFTNRVHQVVKNIPEGQTLTYKQVAELAGSPNAQRAVGNILNKNYNPTIPCHRVIKADGTLGGYNRGVARKQQILTEEKLNAQKALEIKNLHKVYHNEYQALKGLSFSVEEGEFFALLGPNGAGKTSLISLMSGVNRITSGQIKIFGKDITTHSEETKFLLGIVPQEISFDSFFSVNEVLTLQSGYYGIKNNQAYIDEILEKLGLQDKKHTNNKALSGGMKRRLLIAQALVHKPKLVVLDEPTAGVDVELRHSLWTYMRELNKQGTTILLTTHYLEEAENLCNRTAIINKGQLVALDQTKKLIRDMGSLKEMTLNFTKKITTIPEKLTQFAPQKIDTHDLKITFDTSQMDQVFTALKGLPLSDIDLKGQSLEDVFIKLTTQK